MRVVEVVRPGELAVREVPVPVPGPGEVVVRVEAALTCGTDVKLYQRGHPKIPFPAPLGHEFAGVVAAVGAGVASFREGDAVAGVPTAPCGRCRACVRGRENLCPEAAGRIVLGAFAEYVRVPAHVVAASLFPRPAGLAPAVAAALEPLACVVHGAGRVTLERAERVVVLGDGPIALLFVELVRLSGPARVLVVGKHARRLAAARALGAEVLDAGAGPPEAQVREWTGGVGADVVVEAVGRPEVWESAVALAAPGGEVLLFGGCAAGTQACFDTYRLHYDELEVKGAFHYGRADVRRALALLGARRVRVEPLLTHRRPLARAEEALALAASREAIKVVLEPA